MRQFLLKYLLIVFLKLMAAQNEQLVFLKLVNGHLHMTIKNLACHLTTLTIVIRLLLQSHGKSISDNQ